MAWKWYDVTSYRASVGSPGYYGGVQLMGDGLYAILTFHREGPLPDASVTTLFRDRFHGHMDFQQMPIVVDLLRNEEPLRFGWNEEDVNSYKLQTGAELVGEGEDPLDEDET